ncbi:MAG: hypothetical protein ABI613_10630, partial [Gemmatimonadota bacterium]
ADGGMMGRDLLYSGIIVITSFARFKRGRWEGGAGKSASKAGKGRGGLFRIDLSLVLHYINDLGNVEL